MNEEEKQEVAQGVSVLFPIEGRVQQVAHTVYYATSDTQQPIHVQIDDTAPKVGLVLTNCAVCHLADSQRTAMIPKTTHALSRPCHSK